MKGHEESSALDQRASLVSEIRREIETRSRLLLAGVRGQLFWVQTAEPNTNLSAVRWVLRAHEGTLEKVLLLIPPIDPLRGVELVALARNLFENLVWLKLFDRAPEYGLLFYRQLLESQIQSQEQAISQAESEIVLFEEAGKKDHIDFSAVEHIIQKDDPTDDERALVSAHIKAHEKRIDDEVRRHFSVYAHAATHNGYEYQAYLLRNNVIPLHKERRQVNQDHLDELKAALPGMVSGALLADFESRWNWAQRAQAVGMTSHYRFIYSYTSRLLHSTPMNIITSKELDDGERDVLLNYIRTAIVDTHSHIEHFTYPGQVKTLLVNVDGKA